MESRNIKTWKILIGMYHVISDVMEEINNEHLRNFLLQICKKVRNEMNRSEQLIRRNQRKRRQVRFQRNNRE